MPATITHAYFANDVFDILPDNIKDNVNLDRIRMFGQSTDSLIFYNLFSVFSGKKIRNYQHYFHCNKSAEFFINLLRYIKVNKLNDDIDVNSFLSGFICHYVLDSTIHPYIIYKTGWFDKNNKSTYKYNGVHHFMETFLDNDMILRREGKNPYKFPIDKYCFSLDKFSLKLSKCIDFSFKKTFGWNNISKIYFKSLKQMRLCLMIFRRDPYGIKKNIYKFLDTFLPNKCFRLESISYHYPLEDYHNFLNSNNCLWRNPTTYSIVSHESFVDLYLKAIKRAKVLICASYDYINGKAVDLEQIFLNLNYLTGIDCNDNNIFKYFEY